MLPSAFKDRFQTLPDNTRGAAILMLAAFFFAVMTLIVKILGERLHVTQILFVRQIVMTAIVMPMIVKGFPGVLKTGRAGLQLARIGFALCAMLFGFTAVIHLPLADATAIGFAKSFFVPIFATLILAETVGPRRWAAVVMGFAGVMIMLKPGTDGFSHYGLMALAGAAAAGIVMVIIRLMSRTESNTTILTWQAVGIGICMAMPGIWYWQWPTPHEWLLLIAMGGISYIAQMFNIMAYRHGEASVMASLDYVRLVYATFFGWLVFDNLPDRFTFIGAAVIVAASIYTIHRETRVRKDLTSNPQSRSHVPH
ncbi:MAG: DMT family transporter [Nitratireductor sp.]|nr:DMT family transporter [Nitratireductor sp.]